MPVTNSDPDDHRPAHVGAVVQFNAAQWSNSADDLIELAPPDSDWPDQFEIEVSKIRTLLGDVAGDLCFEHVGSTAILGMVAKPIIDILIIPTGGNWPRQVIERQLPLAGYVFWEQNPDPLHLFFVKGMPPFGARRTHHVHVRPPEYAAPVIAFRDYLRAHPQDAEAYATLKRQLSAAHPLDREAYTHGKDHFVADVLRRSPTSK